jgi:hypothetical protein
MQPSFTENCGIWSSCKIPFSQVQWPGSGHGSPPAIATPTNFTPVTPAIAITNNNIGIRLFIYRSPNTPLSPRSNRHAENRIPVRRCNSQSCPATIEGMRCKITGTISELIRRVIAVTISRIYLWIIWLISQTIRASIRVSIMPPITCICSRKCNMTCRQDQECS